MLNFNGNGSGTLLKNYQLSDFSFTLDTLLFPLTTGGTTTFSTVDRRVYRVVTDPTTVVENVQLIPRYAGTLMAIRAPLWTSSNTEAATINEDGFITYVADGDSTFTCSIASPYYTQNFHYSFQTTGGGSVTTFEHWETTGSVLFPVHAASQVDNLINSAGTFSSAKLNLYSSINDTTGVYVRNTGVWTGSVDLSGVAVYNESNKGVYFLATLITPTDAAVAGHTNVYVGTILRFVDNNNVVYKATVKSTVFVTDSIDLVIAHLEWAGSVPTTLKVMKVLPSNYAATCPDHALNYFPVICTNQFRQVFVQDSFQRLPTVSSFSIDKFFNHYPSQATPRMSWSMAIIPGDSGNPVMAVVNGEAVLLCCNYGSQGGPHLGDFISGVNAALTTLGSAYTLGTVSLSSPIAFALY